MPARRLVAHLFLALTLLCAQLALALHLLSHRASESDPGTPTDRVACLLCVAGAHSGGAMPSAAPALLLGKLPVFERAELFWSYLPPVALAFSSRAPPAFP